MLEKIKITPGFNSQLSQTANESGWFSCNLVRWKYGLLEKVGGWKRLFNSQCAGIIRALHGWEDLQANLDLLIGTDGGAQLFVGGTLYSFNLVGGGDSFGTSGTAIKAVATTASTTVTIFTNSLAVATSQVITTKMASSYGGILVPVNSTFSVLSVIPEASATVTASYTFNLATAALSSLVETVPQAVFHLNGPSGASGTNPVPYPNINVTLNNHGLSNGNMFTIDQSTVVNFSFGSSTTSLQFSLNLAGGALVTVGVFDNNNFTFNATPFITGSWNRFGFGNQFNEGENYLTVQTPLPNSSQITESVLLAFLSPNAGGTVEWYLDNLGTNGLAVRAGGPLFVYMPPVSNGAFLTNAGSGTPQINAGMFVAMPQAQVIVWGTEPIIGSGVADPLLLRFSDVGSYSVWTATVSNQAGSYRLSRGSLIVGGIQAPQTTLIWTDLDIWSMSYIGPPLVYGFTVMGTGCGLIAPYARATLGRTTYWQGQNSFWTFGDSGVQPLPCPVWDIIFNNLNTTFISKCFAGANSSFHEVWFFYPSLASVGECDSYVKYNAAENLWDFGTLSRSAWIDNSVFGTPLAGDSNFRVQQHESGYDNDTSPMSGVFAETGYAAIQEGDQIIYSDMVIPDFKWFGTPGSINMTLKTIDYPGDVQNSVGPFTITPTTEFQTFRLRFREVAMHLDWSATSGYSARVEAIKFRVAPSGKRP